MRLKSFVLTLIAFLILASSLCEASDRYHFGNRKHVEVTITPESNEIVAGTIATFTITLKNKSRDSIQIDYPTGQQWDLVIYDTKRQIFRWSNGFTWHKSPHYIPLKPGEERSETLNWVSVNKWGQPLLQGDYSCVGIITCSPTRLVSNKVKFRLTPPSVVAKGTIKTSLNQCFEIELPRFSGKTELVWSIVYKNNDNRIDERIRHIKTNTFLISFLPKRRGHVEFDMYAYPEGLNKTVSLERRSYRIEVE